MQAGIRPDMECGFESMPQSNPVDSQTPGSPPFQLSHYTGVRDPDTLRIISTSFEGNNEQSLESPVVKGSLPNSRGVSEEFPQNIPSPPGWFSLQ